MLKTDETKCKIRLEVKTPEACLSDAPNVNTRLSRHFSSPLIRKSRKSLNQLFSSPLLLPLLSARVLALTRSHIAT